MSIASNDLISDSMTRIATTASKQRKLVAVAAVIIIAAALAGGLYLTKRNSFRAQAAEAYFKARTALTTELRAYSDRNVPAPNKDPKLAKAAEVKAAAAMASFDVDAELKQGIPALEKVADEFPGTLASFDAKMELGGLYYDHSNGAGSFEKAARWFESAASSSPGKEQTAAALSSLGYAQESLGRCADAVKTFDRAYKSGAGSLAGDLLRSKARCQETLGDKPGAKATYDQIVNQFPNTHLSKFADAKRALL